MPIAKLSNETLNTTTSLPKFHVGQKVYIAVQPFSIVEAVVYRIDATIVYCTSDTERFTLPVENHCKYWFADTILLENAIQRLLEVVKKELL